jgi:hypothetical protein
VIYFLQPTKGGSIKIGTTRCLAERLRALQCEHKQPLAVLGVMDGGFKEEAEIHERFQGIRQHKEWFAPTDELWAFIRENTRAWDCQGEPRRVGINIKARKEWVTWLEQGAVHCGLSVSAVIDQATREFAKANGFDEPAPKR